MVRPLRISPLPCVGAWRYARLASAPLLREEHAGREAAMASTLIGKQAVVIGAGMGGLTAGGALADHFGQVVILERDTLPSEATFRAGTPQAAFANFAAAQRPARPQRAVPR